MYSNGPPHMAGQKNDTKLEHTFSSYVRIREVALKFCQRWWTIGRSGERGSGISMLAARHHDDDSMYNTVLLNKYLTTRLNKFIFEIAIWFDDYVKSFEFFDTRIKCLKNINPLRVTVNLTIDMLIIPYIHNREFFTVCFIVRNRLLVN